MKPVPISSNSPVSHLSGLKASESLPYKSFRRCIWYVDQPIPVPLRNITGDSPSGPPPLGITVFLEAMRTLTGSCG